MDKADWNLKQKVADNIVAQLQASTEEEQKALILKLLEQVSEPFLLALDFAYEMTPNQKRGSKGDGNV